MRRAFFFLVIPLILAAMGKPNPQTPLPAACDVLQTIDIAATLGPDTAYVPGHSSQTDSVRLSLCSAELPDLSARMTLMLVENLQQDVPDALYLRDAMADELRGASGSDLVIEEVTIGDAAIWVAEIGQLIVWHRTGRVMFILSPTAAQDRAVAEAAAHKILAAFP